MPALAAKYGARYGGVPPRVLLLPTQTTKPLPCCRSTGRAARFRRCVLNTLMS